MRDTPYAKELATASIAHGAHECRIERLYVKKAKQVEIRFSWWKNGRMTPRPLDVTENELFSLLREAIKKNVFRRGFRSKVSSLFAK